MESNKTDLLQVDNKENELQDDLQTNEPKKEEKMNNNEEVVKRRKELDDIKLRRIQANAFEKYIYETGIATSFQLIFAELITKNIPVKDYYTYTASRLREFGREMDKLNNNNK